MGHEPGVAGFPVHLDTKRRPTLSAALLREAGLTGVTELVARADGPGRIVLESPSALLEALQARLSGAADGAATTPAAALDSLLGDRPADTTRRP
ncbi:MAG TPA: hypothetical protein VND70_01805 [Acidimicrobiales bacterium]|nr:hypothetical protein [Acidimicrobiales bacterium]